MTETVPPLAFAPYIALYWRDCLTCTSEHGSKKAVFKHVSQHDSVCIFSFCFAPLRRMHANGHMHTGYTQATKIANAMGNLEGLTVGPQHNALQQFSKAAKE